MRSSRPGRGRDFRPRSGPSPPSRTPATTASSRSSSSRTRIAGSKTRGHQPGGTLLGLSAPRTSSSSGSSSPGRGRDFRHRSGPPPPSRTPAATGRPRDRRWPPRRFGATRIGGGRTSGKILASPTASSRESCKSSSSAGTSSRLRTRPLGRQRARERRQLERAGSRWASAAGLGLWLHGAGWGRRGSSGADGGRHGSSGIGFGAVPPKSAFGLAGGIVRTTEMAARRGSPSWAGGSLRRTFFWRVRPQPHGERTGGVEFLEESCDGGGRA